MPDGTPTSRSGSERSEARFDARAESCNDDGEFAAGDQGRASADASTVVNARALRRPVSGEDLGEGDNHAESTWRGHLGGQRSRVDLDPKEEQKDCREAIAQWDGSRVTEIYLRLWS
jgi:hypothetical protein